MPSLSPGNVKGSRYDAYWVPLIASLAGMAAGAAIYKVVEWGNENRREQRRQRQWHRYCPTCGQQQRHGHDDERHDCCSGSSSQDSVDNATSSDSSLYRWYRSRRVQDRMSFHDVMEPRNHALDSELLPGTTPDAQIEDFSPKNSNWNHFERFQEDERMIDTNGNNFSFRGTDRDRQHALYSGGGALQQPLQGKRSDDVSSETSDDVSLMSKDQFVWTDARYSPGRRRETNKQADATAFGQHMPTVNSQELLDVPPSPPRRFFRATSLDDRVVAAEQRKRDPSPPSLPQRTTTARPTRSAPPSRPATPGPYPLKARSLSNPDASLPHDGNDIVPTSLAAQVRQSNRAARTSYNARIMPHTVVLMRHGQSMGNENESLYSTTPDNAMPLTQLGWQQARAAGELLRHSILQENGPVHFIVSPYVRTVETFHGIVSAWCDPVNDFGYITDPAVRRRAWYSKLLELGLTWHEDPRIREQDFGNYQDPATMRQYKRDRHNFGAFYYRFPYGESASDVFDRISTFLDSLWRSFDMNQTRHYVIITHGISIRVLLARYFRYTIDQFHCLSNPRNCEMVMLGHDGQGRLQMGGRYELESEVDPATGALRLKGYKYRKRLRVMPRESIPKAKIRISYNDDACAC